MQHLATSAIFRHPLPSLANGVSRRQHHFLIAVLLQSLQFHIAYIYGIDWHMLQNATYYPSTSLKMVPHMLVYRLDMVYNVLAYIIYQHMTYQYITRRPSQRTLRGTICPGVKVVANVRITGPQLGLGHLTGRPSAASTVARAFAICSTH